MSVIGEKAAAAGLLGAIILALALGTFGLIVLAWLVGTSMP